MLEGSDKHRPCRVEQQDCGKQWDGAYIDIGLLGDLDGVPVADEGCSSKDGEKDPKAYIPLEGVGDKRIDPSGKPEKEDQEDVGVKKA